MTVCFYNSDGEVKDERIEEFVDDRVWRSVLSLSLDATDLAKLNKNSDMIESIATFVRESFKIHLTSDCVGEHIRGLDYITVDLKIPSYSNIVANLNVRELLNCTTKKNRR